MAPKQPSIHAFFRGTTTSDSAPAGHGAQPKPATETSTEQAKHEDSLTGSAAGLKRVRKQRSAHQDTVEEFRVDDLEDSDEESKTLKKVSKPESAPAVLTKAEAVKETGKNDENTPQKAPADVNQVLGKASAKPSVKVDGVGAGAIAAASLHAAFDLKTAANWTAGDPVPYAFVAATFNEIAPLSKRLAIIATLTNAFRCVIALTPEDLLPMVYLCVSKVAPAHHGIELGIGDAILIKAVAQATGRQEAQVKKDYGNIGDLGEVASSSKGKQRTMFPTKPLTIRGVFKQLKDIASIEGHKSQDAKKGMIMKLLSAAKDAEAGFIVRSVQGKLRIGLAEQSVLVSLAQAVTLERASAAGGAQAKGDELAGVLETAAASVRKAFSECPNYEKLVSALLEHGTEDLSTHVHFEVGIPVKAMLARPMNGISEVLDKFSDCEFTSEYKYDGERAQVHVLPDGSVSIYSRNLENTTSKYPDIVARMPKALAPGVKSIVLDCEVQAWDSERKVFLPFQQLTTRKRKDVKEDDVKVQVVLYCFDCLFLDGEALIHKSLKDRRNALYGAIIPQEGKVQFATAKTSKDLDELQVFLEESVNACTEGLIVKTLADSYEPSKRSLNWLKLKKDYLEGQGDTFDVVVIGAMHGKGKRTGGFGSFLLAIYDPDSEEYQSISKIGTGFSEELIKDLAEKFQEHIIPKPPRYYRVTDKIVPDVWFDAKVVWEIKAADLSISPVYTAAIGSVDAGKGISIRFPRLVRERDDKGPEETTSPEQVADMYKRQAIVKSSSKAKVEDDFW